MEQFDLTGLPKLVKVDPLNLDKECIRLPSDLLKVSHLAMEARRMLDEAKAKMELTEATVQAEVRADPASFGVLRVTEAAIKGAVARDTRVVEVNKEYVECRHQADLLQAAIQAMEAKKRSLQMLVELLALGYFSHVPISPEGKKAVEEVTKDKVRRFAGKEVHHESD